MGNFVAKIKKIREGKPQTVLLHGKAKPTKYFLILATKLKKLLWANHEQRVSLPIYNYSYLYEALRPKFGLWARQYRCAANTLFICLQTIGGNKSLRLGACEGALSKPIRC